MWHATITVLSYVFTFTTAWCLAVVTFQMRVFGPWLRSITPGERDFWVRMRDWAAASYAFQRAALLPVGRVARYDPVNFTDDPEGRVPPTIRVMP